MERHKRPRTTALIVIVSGALLALGTPLASAAGEFRLIIAPRSTLLTADGNIILDAYLYNDSDERRGAPAPEALFDVVWTLRDTDKQRPERHGSHFGIGTDTPKKYVMNSRQGVHCVLTTHFESEPGDLLEFFISIDGKVNKVKTDLKAGEAIRSNSVILYRPKENEAQH
jgi:hypothetical protein